jgi:hypothetical protein
MSDSNPITPIEFREIARYAGYRIGINGRVDSRHITVGRGCGGGQGSVSAMSDEWHTVTGSITANGYISVVLKDSISGKSAPRLVHRLVLEAFIGPCPPGMECLHLDGNRVNPRLENLRWGTRQQNVDDMRRHGTMLRGSRHGRSKLSEPQVEEIRRLLDRGISQREIGERFGVNQPTISRINTGAIRCQTTQENAPAS